METENTNFLGRTNSWHWLAICLTISLVVAGYFAKDLWRQATKEDLLRATQAEKALADLKALDPDEPDRLLKEKQNFDRQQAQLEAQIQQLGLEALPTNAACVFAVQNALGAALAKYHLRVVTTAAADRTPPPKAASSSAPAAPAVAAATTPSRQMTADEYWKASMEFINTLSGKEKEMALKDAQAKVAKMRRFESEEAKRAALGQKSAAKTATPKTTTTATTTAKRTAAAFNTENLAYEVAGSFRDIFLFFVAESYRRPAYNFSDIRVVPGDSEDEPMSLFFTLQVNWK